MGALERLEQEVMRQGRQIDVLVSLLTEGKGKAQETGYLKVSALMKKYCVSRSTINNWLHQMEANGYSIEIRRTRANGDRRINAEQFHRAYIALDSMRGKEVA